ncbi:MAG TPA: hypothetical protein PKL83_04880, partial [bacterium]|nr:hypothetical protein [bacterium]
MSGEKSLPFMNEVWDRLTDRIRNINLAEQVREVAEVPVIEGADRQLLQATRISAEQGAEEQAGGTVIDVLVKTVSHLRGEGMLSWKIMRAQLETDLRNHLKQDGQGFGKTEQIDLPLSVDRMIDIRDLLRTIEYLFYEALLEGVELVDKSDVPNIVDIWHGQNKEQLIAVLGAVWDCGRMDTSELHQGETAELARKIDRLEMIKHLNKLASNALPRDKVR